MQNKFLFGHTSLETAYKVDDYPYGYTLRTSIFYWIETAPKKGDRFCSATLNPKTGRMNKPKKSTYYNLAAMYLNGDGHVKFGGVTIYTDKEKVTAFVEQVGMNNLNHEQVKQYNGLMGINEVKVDEFTGKAKKDFAVKWERETIGQGWKDGKWNPGEKGKYVEVRLTFDRPDGVALKEIYKAMKTLDQEKLNQVFEIRDYGRMGTSPGTVRIYVRGGTYLGAASQEGYKEFLASDANVMEEELANE